jgi:acetylornithine/succinyldiaminopimelate/putrescine aminotransferase
VPPSTWRRPGGFVVPNVLLICDEIQTGLGRTGCLLRPSMTGEGLMAASALRGGLIPVSPFLPAARSRTYSSRATTAARSAATRLPPRSD